MRFTAALAALFAAYSVSAAPVSAPEVDARGFFSDATNRLGSGIQSISGNAGVMIEDGGAALSNAVSMAGQGADAAAGQVQQAAQGMVDVTGHFAKGAGNLMTSVGQGLASCASGENAACNK